MTLLVGEREKMSHHELKGFICRDDSGKQYTVIEYRPPAPQKTPNSPNGLNATGSIRFFKTTAGLEVVQISATIFKIVQTRQLIKSEAPI